MREWEEIERELDAAMADADDFEPGDIDARRRSDQAKRLAETARDWAGIGRWTDAIDAAKDAIRIINGN